MVQLEKCSLQYYLTESFIYISKLIILYKIWCFPPYVKIQYLGMWQFSKFYEVINYDGFPKQPIVIPCYWPVTGTYVICLGKNIEFHSMWCGKSHSNQILKDDYNEFQCRDCGADCGDRTNLDEHIAEYHEFGTFFCEICPPKFSTNGDLYFHKLNCYETEF